MTPPSDNRLMALEEEIRRAGAVAGRTRGVLRVWGWVLVGLAFVVTGGTLIGLLFSGPPVTYLAIGLATLSSLLAAPVAATYRNWRSIKFCHRLRVLSIA